VVPADPEAGRRRTKRLIIVGVVLAVAAVVATLFAWQAMERQSRAQRRAVAEKVAEARATDTRLREAAAPLEQLVVRGVATREEALETLGPANVNILKLDEALEVSATFLTELRTNPTDVPNTIQGATASLREDETQLALVEPVLAGLETAETAVVNAVKRAVLGQAMAELNTVTGRLTRTIESASRVKVRVDARIAELNGLPGAEDGTAIGSQADAGENAVATASPNPDPTGKAKTKKTAKKGSDPEKPKVRTAKQEKELTDLRKASLQLTQSIGSAKAILGAAPDQSDLDAIGRATAERRAARKDLALLWHTILREYPNLPKTIEADLSTTTG
jgi:hypothetical protein